jgi:hypothetical protein
LNAGTNSKVQSHSCFNYSHYLRKKFSSDTNKWLFVFVYKTVFERNLTAGKHQYPNIKGVEKNSCIAGKMILYQKSEAEQLTEKRRIMKNNEKVRRESETKWMNWGYQSKNEKYDFSHERFVVPWQLDRKEKKMATE